VRREDLSPQQQRIVDATSKHMLVVGGAGTGKTTTALWAARAELEREGNQQKRALFLTFSRTAVDQITTRSRAVIGPVEDRVEVSTFHSFAFRLVRTFGYLAGVAPRSPELQSLAEIRLLGSQPGRLSYDDLAPMAMAILDHPRVAGLVRRRWCIVICDEFQDTNDDQWSLLERLGDNARLLLLGDNNQLIYGFLSHTGVSSARLDHARASADAVVELEEVSHRDPSGAIPALAKAVRLRAFGDPAIQQAVLDQRLHVRVGVDDDSIIDVIASALDDAWARGSRSFGIFAHSNQGVAELSSRLNERGIDHYLVGLPEAESAALGAMLSLTQYALSQGEWDNALVSFGTFLTACVRGNQPPFLARALAAGVGMPVAIEGRLAELRGQLDSAASSGITGAAEVAVHGWPAIGVTAGAGPWARSVDSFLAMARRAEGSSGRPRPERLGVLEGAVADLRVGALLDSTRRRLPPVQLMNFHQTKGREADAVIILYGDEDYLAGGESDPFPAASRLVYVALTRARKEITIVLGDGPHELVAPFGALA
jgi:DNA helicase-2/ATP-dependent DNA helicase PcrA